MLERHPAHFNFGDKAVLYRKWLQAALTGPQKFTFAAVYTLRSRARDKGGRSGRAL